MHGHGYAPQQPQQPPPVSGGTHVTLRVVFVVLAFMTCGLFAWAPMLRLAIVTRKPHDWALFGLVTALDVTALVLVGVDPGEEEFQGPGNAGMVVLLTTLVAAVAYYLYADIRHFSRYRTQQYGGYAGPQPAYGYPQQPGPAPVHQQPTQPHQPPVQQTPPPPTRPAPARIHQVQAELDELSDYLRKQEGGN
ncbi:hypothetical protein OG302_24840 [Streptomyces sp. NBC_01283]|uniref:hypothetical protein n=1 Tax=Streptomyces sp. NBC_01283 TaxID=2903812 RepID=UPI00352F4682|nr:hypothetical protein OG302_24840 [Streptomyces sp. NBC_01283]